MCEQCQRNCLLWKYIKSQQWRWEQQGKDLFRVTGEAQARLWLPTEEKRKWCVQNQWTEFASFLATNQCNVYQTHRNSQNLWSQFHVHNERFTIKELRNVYFCGSVNNFGGMFMWLFKGLSDQLGDQQVTLNHLEHTLSLQGPFEKWNSFEILVILWIYLIQTGGNDVHSV